MSRGNQSSRAVRKGEQNMNLIKWNASNEEKSRRYPDNRCNSNGSHTDEIGYKYAIFSFDKTKSCDDSPCRFFVELAETDDTTTD